MKIYLLYENPYGEGDNVFGAFSTEDKVNEALEIFSPINPHELFVRELELDDLEKHYEKSKSGKFLFHGYMRRIDIGKEIVYGAWDMTRTGLDSFFDKKENAVSEFENCVYASIFSESSEAAIEIANKIIEEKSEGYSKWLE